VVWAVHKFDFRLLINGSKNCCAVTNLFFDNLCVFPRPPSQRTRCTLCILFPLHCKTNGAHWGNIFFVSCQLREFAQRFGVGLPQSSCTREGNPHFWGLLAELLSEVSLTSLPYFVPHVSSCCTFERNSKFRMSVVVVVVVASVCAIRLHGNK
jgi:hypothetical protein